MRNFVDWSYAKHSEEDNASVPNVILGQESLDTWLHTRMHELLLPLIEAYPDSEWLTVGDGRFGSDANFLIKRGVRRVVATDLSDDKLKQAKERGFIREFSAQNVEKLSFEDNSFDFVLCKETYHHLPRPPVAFYEMLRVSRKAVALIEPMEGPPKPLDKLKLLAKRIIQKDHNYLYEKKGNFLYRTGLRELEKMMTAIDKRAIAFRQINTLYMGKSLTGSNSFNKAFTQAGILAQDMLCKLSLMNFGMACAICFKDEPDGIAVERLKGAGFEVRSLPRNPYV